MPIKVIGLMHAGLRVAPDETSVEHAKTIYGDLLGLQIDANRPEIPGIPGFWFDIEKTAETSQVHIMGVEGKSSVARSDKHDPARPHLAFAVEDIQEAKQELDRREIEFWVFSSLIGSASEQIFFEDGFGNVIELQQKKN